MQVGGVNLNFFSRKFARSREFTHLNITFVVDSDMAMQRF